MRLLQRLAIIGIALLSFLVLGGTFAVSALERTADTPQQTD